MLYMFYQNVCIYMIYLVNESIYDVIFFIFLQAVGGQQYLQHNFGPI